MNGPLRGVRVLDLTSVVSGPNATMMLADQGADVVKVEAPGGDIMRRGSVTPGFVSSNRSKRSIAVDLKRPTGAGILRRLIATADVLVQNFRPGVAERLGFGEEAARAIKPDLVYASISGVGETGPTSASASTTRSSRRFPASPTSSATRRPAGRGWCAR
jgi:crotonobetainyl-CoA:carnitine CoA-transferase CaiB-like acyl-CoA transferase